MALFRFEAPPPVSPYRSPYTGSLAELAGGADRARAQEALAQGQRAAGIAQAVGGSLADLARIPAQMTQQRADTQRLALGDLQVADAQQRARGQSSVDAMMAGDRLPAGDVGPRQDSYLTKDGLFDVPKLNQALAQSGMAHLAPDLLKGAENINASIAKHQEDEQKAASGKTLIYGDMADSALKLAKIGMPLPAAMDFVVQPGLATKRINPDEYAQLKQQISALPPDQQAAALTTFMDAAAKIAPNKTLGKDSQEVDRYGRVTATNVIAEPNKGDYTGPDGIRYHANGTPVTGAVMKPQGAPKSIESKAVLLDGRPSFANYDPSKGTYALPDGTDVSARVKPIPAAAITINNERNKGLALPAWATDGSRPTGTDANTPDPAIKMTPNGLHQAALNYIANGQYPPTGRGTDAIAVAQREAISSKVGAIAADAGMDLPTLRASYKSNASSLAQQQKMFDTAQSNINTADRNVAELDKYLGKIPDTGSPLFNQPLRTFATRVQGDPNMGPIATYLASVQNEYGKIISSSNGSSVLTDSARHEAQQLIDPNATVAQMLGSIQALKTEGGNRLLSVGEQIQRIQQRMQNGGAAAPGGPVEVWEKDPTTGKYVKKGGR